MDVTIIDDLTVNIGFVKIHLPDYTISTFLIAQSLAEEFGVETNYDALKKLRKALRSSNDDLHKKVKTDSEGGCVYIHASSKRAEEILRVAIVINELAIEPYHAQIDTDNLEKIKHILLKWKRPKPQKWKVGDIFSIPLGDGTFSFGQILWEQYRSPNCALFDCRDKEILPIEKIISSSVISVLDLGPENLNNFDWRIVGNAPVKIDMEQVPQMHRGFGVGTHSYAAEHFSYLAKAYYRLKPWNAEANLDVLLMPNVKRPENVLIYNQQELNEYFRSRGRLYLDEKR